MAFKEHRVERMNVSGFFNTYTGMYMAQAFTHSIIAFIIVERVMQLWNISNPLIRQRFGLLVIVLPVVSFPLYQVINPGRSSISFRLGALFDITRWFNLDLWGAVPVGLFFIIMIIITAKIFLFQEMIPVIKHTLESKRFSSDREDPDPHPSVQQALEFLSAEETDIVTLDDDDFILFSSTGRNPAIFISTGIVETLSTEQLRAVIAHELAHIRRNKKPLLTVAFLFRVAMFFNPAVLIEFRRIVQEEEKICDDMAVRLTRDPAALSEALKKLYYKDTNLNPLKFRGLFKMRDSLEEYSHSVQIGARIVRLEKASGQSDDGNWVELFVTVFVILGINYFIV